ncbi:MAG: hypothetical protein KAS26_07455 [Sulfurimonas sp.]|nr:hypothetical protein [Sulfurimonas sp.]
MKSYLLQAITAFLLFTPLLQAQTQQKKIIISSTTTGLKAKQEFDKVHKYISAYPKIISILKENNVNFTSRPSGNYHIVVMEPFSDKKTLREVTDILKKRYTGAYVNNYTPPATTQTLPAIVEPIIAASKIEDSESIESTNTAEPINTKEVSVSEAEAETTKEVVENVTKIATNEAIEDAITQTEETPTEEVKEETLKVVEEDNVESTVTKKESFIIHTPTAEKEKSHTVLPPWWVILSVLAIIFAAFNDTIEARRRK